jgi:hypothetical protein
MLSAFIHAVIDWFKDHEWVAWLMLGLSLTTVLATLFFVPWAIVRIPPDYFVPDRPPQTPWKRLHPAARTAVVVVKNLLGIVLFLAGIVLSLPLVPGPGIITMLVGLALIDVPGKRALERRIVAQPQVLRALNKLRAKYGKPPLEKPE